MPLTPDAIVQRRRDALAADVGGELVLMSLEHGKYYGLDAIGAEIWKRIELPVTVRDLCAALVVRYAGDPAVIERDVVILLDRLADQGLLEPQAA
jgi:hypothetical protein